MTNFAQGKDKLEQSSLTPEQQAFVKLQVE